LRLVGVGQTLTVSVLAMSIEMPVGVTIKPKNLIFCMWKQALLGFGVQVIFMKMFQDVSDVDPMVF